ncbi:hypothetical protein EVA_11396 [gut metagenome]|uniref:Uncharacterized protein n=1 Tax=gut metagenome TaxID=749906 RepID=J9GFA2_9ZZZZ
MKIREKTFTENKHQCQDNGQSQTDHQTSHYSRIRKKRHGMVESHKKLSTTASIKGRPSAFSVLYKQRQGNRVLPVMIAV